MKIGFRYRLHEICMFLFSTTGGKKGYASWPRGKVFCKIAQLKSGLWSYSIMAEMLQKLYEEYKSTVCKNAATIGQFESAFRIFSYVIAGRLICSLLPRQCSTFSRYCFNSMTK